ncbi:MAG: hypothetical protein KJ043_03345, partial [Anaerolineae bacterium]|nr:hypothetical protein [Anaerolineae bacterium]
SPNFSGAITQGIFIIGFGYLLLYLRKRALKKAPVQDENITILSDFIPKNRSIMGYGGAITVFGILWLILLSVQITHNSQVRRYCLNNPYDNACVYDSPFPKFPCQDYQLEAIYIVPYITGFMLGFLLFPMFAGQMLVVIPHATRWHDKQSEG